MRPPIFASISRLSVRPDSDDPDAIVGPRPRGSRRPHTDARVAAVRRLIEQTTLTYAQIAARTGVARASICRWTRDGGWKRPPFAPRATDTVPTARASLKLKMRTLAARLAALAERHLRELEQTPGVDLDKLAEALELFKMAKLAALPHHRPRKRRRSTQNPFAPPRPEEPAEAKAKAGVSKDEADRERSDRGLRPIAQLCVGDVDLHRAPRAAIEDFLAHREPPPKEALPRRSRARRAKRDEYHA